MIRADDGGSDSIGSHNGNKGLRRWSLCPCLDKPRAESAEMAMVWWAAALNLSRKRKNGGEKDYGRLEHVAKERAGVRRA
jgi:hypothetical protein